MSLAMRIILLLQLGIVLGTLLVMGALFTGALR